MELCINRENNKSRSNPWLVLATKAQRHRRRVTVSISAATTTSPPNPPALSLWKDKGSCTWMRVLGQVEPRDSVNCPLKQAWGNALIGRLRAAYEENGGLPERNPFAGGGNGIGEGKRSPLQERKKKTKKRNPIRSDHDVEDGTAGTSSSNLPS
ncbi:LOW QUALITY PROTEIN: hypothetical protein HID58_007938 [Brassica napus]|uniref:ALOG domain-containing protein n=1 Tax=Brassica napus TaxID=3708 RepID=A0ABQ7XJG7_BRANA|nr:LOW QUALITY PROTEIN: hypothetical protein HID58_007938 [Brassica napus]